MLQYLKPVSESHSIKNVVASVFTPQAFLKPQDIFEKVKTLGGYKSYPNKGLTRATTINIDNRGFGIIDDANKGFILESYDEKGAVNHVFRLENISENQAKISLENRKYTSWSTFKDKLKADFITFSEVADFYVQAISLNFRNEFIWTSKEENIKVKDIFNVTSVLINEKFINSKNGTCIIVSQGDENEKVNFEEKIEISFNNDVKRIAIDYHYAQIFKEIKLFSELDKDTFSGYYDKAHAKNKDLLKDVLSKNTQILINLI